jgi:hypothetical protein
MIDWHILFTASIFFFGFPVLDDCDESLDFYSDCFLVRSCLAHRSFMMKAFLELKML